LHSSRGVTLLELLAVIVVFSLLLALSVALLQGANRDLGVGAAANHVAGLLRVAHQRARGDSSPAWVALDTKQNSVALLIKETVGEWHFEDTVTTGAFGRNAQVSGNTSHVPARVGYGFQLTGSSSINCGEVPVYDPDQGIAIEFWFLRRSYAGRMVLCTVGDMIEVSAGQDGRIDARVGALRVSSDQIRLPLEAWCYLQLICSGSDLRLLLNQRQVARTPGKAGWVKGGNFVIGNSRSGLMGIVDEARLSLIIPRNLYRFADECVFEFPEGFKVPADGQVVIAFDQEGRLDGSFTRPFQFWIKSPSDRKGVEVGLGGNIRK
jgi:prepilin-type N-terminal cleavage/methylation domain-containing protein